MRDMQWVVSRSDIGSLVAMKTVSTMRTALLIASLFTVGALSGCGEEAGRNALSAKVGVGDEAPKSHNRTVTDSVDWHQVSTMDTRVDLYQWEIADLIDRGQPFLVVFGTPQHCTMCVDQIVRVQVMQEMFGDRFAFIHVDGYKNNPVWVEWGVTGEPWTYFVDRHGRVSNVLPGQTELGLLEEEMRRLLEDKA